MHQMHLLEDISQGNEWFALFFREHPFSTINLVLLNLFSLLLARNANNVITHISCHVLCCTCVDSLNVAFC